MGGNQHALYTTPLLLIMAMSVSQIDASGVNIALGKSSYQSTTYCHESTTPCGPGNAVDGDGTEWVNDQFMCTHTTGQYPHWWVVDLGDTYNIKNVIIYNRQSAGSDWLNNYDIDVFTEPACFCDKWTEFPRGRQSRCHYQSSVLEYLNATCVKESIGRFLRIQLRESTSPLCLCEVEVYGKLVQDSTLSSSSRKACGFPNQEYTGITMTTTKTRSNAECASMCMATRRCCAGVYEKSTKNCTLKRKIDEEEETTHSLATNPSKVSWLV